MSIPTATRNCTQLLHSAAISEPQYETWTEDQTARLNLWAASLGVFASGHLSIEHRFRLNAFLLDVVNQLLEGICDCLAVLIGSDAFGSASTSSPRAASSGHSLDCSTDSSDGSDGQLFDRDNAITPALLLREVEDHISRLVGISVELRSRSAKQHDERAAQFEPSDGSGKSMLAEWQRFARFQCRQYLEHARSTGIATELPERLLRALELRWRLMCYQSHHATRLARHSPGAVVTAGLGAAVISPPEAQEPSRSVSHSEQRANGTGIFTSSSAAVTVVTDVTQQSSAATFLSETYRPQERDPRLASASVATSVPAGLSTRLDFPRASLSSSVHCAGCCGLHGSFRENVGSEFVFEEDAPFLN